MAHDRRGKGVSRTIVEELMVAGLMACVPLKRLGLANGRFSWVVWDGAGAVDISGGWLVGVVGWGG